MNGIESARKKVIRASEHLQALELQSAAFASDESNFVIEESYGEQHLRFIKEPPDEMFILAGEIVYQLRSSLNHLAFELVKSNTSVSLLKGWEDRCEFPLFCSVPKIGNPPSPMTRDQLFELFNKKHLPGITKASFAVVEALQPYNGGNTAVYLGWLAKLSNVDKHRHFHVLIRQAYQHETIISPRINSHTLARLEHGAKVEAALHSPDELADAVDVKRSFGDASVAFDEPALPDLNDVPLDNVLDLCVNAIDSRVVPAFEKLINGHKELVL